MHRGQCRREVGVALVRDEHERAGVGDQGVASGDPDVGVDEALAQLLPRNGDKRRDVVGDRVTDDLAEELRDFFARFVDGRCDEVGRPLAGELNDPFAEVGLDRVYALRLEVIGESDLLRRHRLRLHDELRLLRAADRRDDAARLLGVDRPVDLRADRLGLARESFDERRHLVDGLRFAGGQVGTQPVPIDLAHSGVAAFL